MPYDERRAELAVRFIEKLKHTKGEYAGRNFLLQEWQKDIIRPLFGTVNDDGTRQYRTAYIEVPRKNGKSELAAAISLLLLFFDGEPGAEIYSAAADRDQASIVFNVASDMVRQEPALAKRCKIIDSTKRVLSGNSFYRVLSADAHTKHGFNAHGVIFDELHAQPNRDLWDVLTTSGGTRRQPLVLAITTAGYDRNSICWEQHEYARKVIDGVIEDPTFFGVIYAAEDTDDWTDEAVWHKANPALGTFRSLDEMRSLCEKAKQVPSLQNTFRRLYLNQWTSQENRWLDLRVWRESAGVVIPEDLAGEECYAGLDLASVSDIAAFVMVFPDQDNYYDVLPVFFIPEENMWERAAKDRVPYDAWARDGQVIATPGNVIDFRFIREKIVELGQEYHIREIAFDRWGAAQISQDLQDEGFTMVPFGQGFGSMAAPTKELLNLVLQRKIRHGDHPVLTWMADNMVVKQDPAGNVKPDKAKSTEKIDGMVALIMGLDRALRNQATAYNDRGIVTI